ncbi:LytR/AlgR family response regulator transcription factor [Aureivirga sp. CE67]|uniref:LytR/AlgR family response regulator transcription factor n=1 Tax=Aureivirga sp. CE67 TaxID=1788983 RepID=UPI0018C9BEE6|nr:LytTR family DNA-binding domain-containing protein [Aureivirga sp. CE67]
MLRIVIVDDEKDALEALEWKLNRYIDDVSVTKCNTAQNAIETINNQKPDLVFLDIEMPEMNGFTLLEKLEYRNFKLIFNTAYSEFALKAIKVSAIDYLLKPVDKDELIEAVEKVRKKEDIFEDHFQTFLSNFHKQNEKINIAADGKVYLLDKCDIVMLKSDKSYTTIYLNDGVNIVVSKTLKEVEKKFTHTHFFRVHNSYLINLSHVKEYSKGIGGELMMSNGMIASVSRNKKNELFKKLDLN